RQGPLRRLSGDGFGAGGHASESRPARRRGRAPRLSVYAPCTRPARWCGSRGCEGGVGMTRTGSGDQIGVAEARPEAVMRHHRAAWRLERVAWGVMALLLLATLLGAFGGGPLSHARSSAGPASLEY